MNQNWKAIVDEMIQQTVREVLEDIRFDSKCNQDPKSIYAKTESLLYNLPELKKAVKERQDQIQEIEKYGVQKGSKSVTTYFANSGYIDTTSEYEKKERHIEQQHAAIKKLECRIEQIETALNAVRQDPYFSIISLKYFDKKTNAEIAELLECNESTVTRRKNKLLETIKMALFGDDVLNEMLKWFA